MVIVLAWLISVVLRVAQGSATVAIVTTAGNRPGPGRGRPPLAGVARSDHHGHIGTGSIFASNVNAGGFWIVAKYFGVSERDTLKSWTVPETVLSVAGFAVAGFAVAGFAVAGFAVAGFAVAAARSLIV